jgi:Protein of unknown function (DUF2946)
VPAATLAALVHSLPTPRQHQRLLTWLALVAVLGMALLPTLSHALAFARGDASRWAEVCTPQGMRLVAVDDSAGAEDKTLPTASGQLEHCPLCALGAGAMAPPPAPLAVLWLPLAGAEPPTAFLQAPRTAHAWRSAQPRGPPSFS